jgi:purine-nucleoside phosphorylase
MLYDQIQEALQFIRTKTDFQPKVGVILGTGLGNFTDEIRVEIEIPYADIPHFPISTVQSHKGKLIFGWLGEKPVVCMAGRFHYYEGYSMRQVTFPVRVLKFLGIENLIISNVSGSTNAHIHAGDIVVLKDHINLQGDNPLRGDNDERLGVRFPDMLHTYNMAWNKVALDIAKQHNFRAHEGVYVALQGPNLETPAEYQFMHRIGADLVGMSTVPEVLVARHSGLGVFAISVVSNQSYPINTIQATTLEAVIEIARIAEPRMTLIIKALVNRFV